MVYRHRRHAVLVFASLMISSCGLFGRFKFEVPTVELDRVAVTGIGLDGGSLNLVLDVYNPNAYDIRTTRIEAGLHLEETHFGDVQLERHIDLKRQAHTSVELPITFTWRGVGAGARALLSQGSVRYRLRGRVFVDTPGGSHGFDVRRSGLVTLADLGG